MSDPGRTCRGLAGRPPRSRRAVRGARRRRAPPGWALRGAWRQTPGKEESWASWESGAAERLRDRDRGPRLGDVFRREARGESLQLRALHPFLPTLVASAREPRGDSTGGARSARRPRPVRRPAAHVAPAARPRGTPTAPPGVPPNPRAARTR